jgi:hypothetical protein
MLLKRQEFTMRKEIGKACRGQFRAVMAAEFADFHEDKTQEVPQGWYPWTQKHPSGIFFHIVLVLHPKKDKITIEGGWSLDGKLKPTTTLEGRSVILSRPERFRLPFLWEPTGDEFWWHLVLRPEEYERGWGYEHDPIQACVPLVAPAIADMGEQIKAHLIPLFDEIVKRHGNSIKQ